MHPLQALIASPPEASVKSHAQQLSRVYSSIDTGFLCVCHFRRLYPCAYDRCGTISPFGAMPGRAYVPADAELIAATNTRLTANNNFLISQTGKSQDI